jgi:hypothetical protein
MVSSPHQTEEMRLKADKRRQYHTMFALLAVCASIACGDGDDAPRPPAELTGFARLADAVVVQPDSGSGPVEPPQRIAGVELSTDLSQDLQASDREVSVVIRLMVAADGTVMGAKIQEVRPLDLPLAQRFAEEVSQSVWGWRYRPATEDGAAVRGIVDLTFETRGGRAGD